jgi:hypothetical protein
MPNWTALDISFENWTSSLRNYTTTVSAPRLRVIARSPELRCWKMSHFVSSVVCPKFVSFLDGVRVPVPTRARNRQRHAVGQDDKHHIPWRWIGEMSAPSTILDVVE